MPTEIAPGLLSWASILEEKTREQAETTASLSWIKPHVALMPDAHWGMGSTVGSVIPTEDVVMPAAVGVDIGCVDADTEYLSPTGWRRIKDYAGEQVMQYEPISGAARFVQPERFIVKDCPEFLHFRTKYGINQMLSPDHRMLIWRIKGRDRRREIDVVTAANFEFEHTQLVQGLRAEFETAFAPFLDTKLGLSDDQIRVQVMFHADGHLDKYGTGVLRFKKTRKITRARMLLLSAGITEWSENTSSDGVTTLRFEPPRQTKVYDASWFEASADQLTVISEEVLHWDGNLEDRCYFTRDRASADFMHYVFSATGWRSVLRADVDEDGMTDYRVFAHPNTRTSMVGSPKTPVERVPSANGKAYCFTLPSGFWVMRRGGNIAMTGNCGMSATLTQLTRSDIEQNPRPLSDLRYLIEAFIPLGPGQYRSSVSSTAEVRIDELEELAVAKNVNLGHSPKWRQQLGTLGGGTTSSSSAMTRKIASGCSCIPDRGVSETRSPRSTSRWLRSCASGGTSTSRTRIWLSFLGAPTSTASISESCGGRRGSRRSTVKRWWIRLSRL